MKQIDWKTVAIAGLVAAVVVLVGQERAPALASTGGTDSNSDMIAVTGEFGNGTSVLYVIDTKSRNLAVYRSQSGSGVELVAARRIKHDLKLLSYHDRTPSGFAPGELEKNYLRFRTGETPPVEDKAPAAPATPEEKK